MTSLEKNWYAVYTRPRFEKKISQVLEKREIPNFCPLNRVVRQWADRKKTVMEPLFSCYVFVHITRLQIGAVKSVEGILNFVHWMGVPATIKGEEIEAIRRFLDDHENVKIEKISVSLHDSVRVINGPLTMEEGKVVELKNSSVKVLLPSLGYAMLAEVSLRNIEIISSSHLSKRNHATG